jgi:peptidoglycan-associated lipoprotein
MTKKIPLLFALVLFGASFLFAQSQLMANANNDLFAAPDGAGAPTADALPPSRAEQIDVQQNIKDVHFDFDRADLRMDDRNTLQADAQWLKAHPDVLVTIEGDADERGDIVYNVQLSEKRATATKDALVSMGVPADQIVFATGWGKLYPICDQSDESCWSENRRAHFAAW